jgi:hypothetical protein
MMEDQGFVSLIPEFSTTGSEIIPVKSSYMFEFNFFASLLKV